jgi:hypothetical protein
VFKFKKNAIVILSLLLFTGFSAIAGAATPASCDRACLGGFVTQYLNAILAHKPDSLPLAANVRFTEDCKELKLGEGIWKSTTRLTDYRRDILDVRQGVAVSYLVVDENASPVLFVLRLKIVDDKIAEIESTAVRGKAEGMFFNTDNLKTASKTMLSVPDKAQMNSREDMIKMALTYPAGLKVGSFVKVDSAMMDDAYRFENGQLMASPGCTFFKGCDNMKK